MEVATVPLYTYTGHPLVDVGASVIAVFARRHRVEDIQQADLDTVREFIRRHYVAYCGPRPPRTNGLTRCPPLPRSVGYPGRPSPFHHNTTSPLSSPPPPVTTSARPRRRPSSTARPPRDPRRNRACSAPAPARACHENTCPCSRGRATPISLPAHVPAFPSVRSVSWPSPLARWARCRARPACSWYTVRSHN